MSVTDEKKQQTPLKPEKPLTWSEKAFNFLSKIAGTIFSIILFYQLMKLAFALIIPALMIGAAFSLAYACASSPRFADFRMHLSNYIVSPFQRAMYNFFVVRPLNVVVDLFNFAFANTYAKFAINGTIDGMKMLLKIELDSWNGLKHIPKAGVSIEEQALKNKVDPNYQVAINILNAVTDISGSFIKGFILFSTDLATHIAQVAYYSTKSTIHDKVMPVIFEKFSPK